MRTELSQPRAAFLRNRWRHLAAVILTLGVLAGSRALADDTGSLESRVKSALVYNFIQFVDWPDSAFAKPDDPLVIGVLDPDPLEGALSKAVEGKTIKGRRIVVRHLSYPGSLAGCHVLYVGPQYATNVPEILKGLDAGSVLTIGDPDGFTQAGGMIRIFKEDRFERFEINPAAAERAHLQISSKLLKLARIYQQGGRAP